MFPAPRHVAGVLVTLSLAAIAACGGDSPTSDSQPATSTEAPSADSTEAPAVETTDVPEPEPEPDQREVLGRIRSATVKIGSQGTFVDPAFGTQYNAAGVGTGFIIDPSGIAVTNNHVVTGAALLQVYLNDSTRPVNARVLGVSECSDLAVIVLDGDGYEALDFGDPNDIIEGLQVIAAGFPLTLESTIEAVDYTLTQGIISSTTADGETSWASVDSVLEHDARIRGGNSGGPLVDTLGKVLGVNYSGFEAADQNFAIGIDIAVPIIERLRAGENVESLGINGQAIIDEQTGLSGIWVASVESGSPASTVGIAAGDIITSMEGLLLATDGTMSDYCDIIRTRGPDAVYRVEVLRYATDEVLEGEINGRPLETSFSFAQEIADVDPGAGVGGDVYNEYMTVTDDTGQLSVELPIEWSDIDGSVDENFGPSIYAAPDLDGYLNTWDVPGVVLEVSGDYGAADVGSMLDSIGPAGSCATAGRQPYEDPLYVGEFEVWTDCDGTDTIVITMAVTPYDGSYMIRMSAQVVTARDLDALDQIFNTFIAFV